jgi:high-affinity Fe2+/Pb2+ permease
MNKNVLNYLSRLEGFKLCCKNMHFSAKSMSEHKLFDDMFKLLCDKQDEIAEIEQGLHGQYNKKALKCYKYVTTSSKVFLQDVLSLTKSFYKIIKKEKGDDYIGMISVLEDFIAKLNKLPYLLSLCLKEDFKRQFKNKILEERQMKKNLVMEDKSINSTTLKLCIREAIEKVLNRI